MFTVYATNEDVINRLIDDLSNEYDNLWTNQKGWFEWY
jgi:hypothetical protein